MMWSPPKFLVASPSNAGFSLRVELSSPCRWTEKREQAWGDLVETRLGNLILGPEKGVT